MSREKVAGWARRSGALGLTVAAGLLVAPRPGDARGLARPAVLASYSFDDDVATGPDTFAIWQGARHNKGGRGHVRLSSAFHVSGHRSVELMDVVGDGDFPELQGYFPVRRAGQLFFHFAFLTSDPQQELNVALAGPRYFQLEKDGIAFWLGTRDGRLVHYSDSIPKRLFVPEAFVWYAVDVTYDIAAGRYDLVIHAEGKEQPIVSLLAQPNAAGQPGSTVDKFSFVGAPFADTSSVVYYLDDVVIGTDESVTKLPFTAPGRRKLFIDSFGEYQRLLRERPRCLPATSPEDFGLAPSDLQALVAAGFGESLQRLIAAPDAPSPRLPSERGPERWRRVLEAAFAWNEGCSALERGNASLAHARFAAAAEAAPEGPLFSLSAALALAALGRIEEADDRLALVSEWRHEPRYAVASAYVGLARRDLERALEWLRDPAARALDREVPSGGEEPVAALVTEQYYYVLLWKGAYDDARDYALRAAERSGRARLPTAPWTARAADASFYGRDTREARELYESALAEETDWAAQREIYLKLADLAFLAGDLTRERRLREHYYGQLRE
ncbi:MAG TPA: tetratricopeptide repeat protein [Vicinamibacteria bacterium]|nr:tetratricopeptide repeat protein [Vicinamibacteria bacterium]